MLISQKSKEIIDSCRFCWMCRHICPIGNATGQERNTARARALSLSLVTRGGMDYSSDVIDNVYECGLCGACTQDCATGWDPVVFTKEARLAAAMDGKTPEYIKPLIENVMETGNIYGKKDISDKLKAKINSLPKEADTLLFLGSDARYIDDEAAVKAIELLEKAGVSFTALCDEPDSGYALDTLIGAAEETRQTMIETAKKLNYKTIVAYDPADAKVFLREYKEWNIDLKANVKTFTSFVNGLIKDGSLKVKKSDTVYTFQDPSLLARDLEETDDARDILNACGKISDMLLAGKATVWAGNLILNEYLPDVMKLTAERRWENTEYAKADVLVTAYPAEHVLLSKTMPEGKKIMTVEEVVLSALN